MAKKLVKSENTRPSLNKKASQDLSAQEDLHQYVRRALWPLDDYNPKPSLANVSETKKTYSVYLPERLWVSVQRHCKAMGLKGKQDWIIHALMLVLEQEQLFFRDKKGSK